MQTLIHRALEQDLLVGTGLATAIGPCPNGRENDCHEYFQRIRFSRAFWRAPKVMPFLISTLPASDDPCLCSLTVRSITADGFTLSLRSRPGTARMDVEFGWVASGEIAPALPEEEAGYSLPDEAMGHDI